MKLLSVLALAPLVASSGLIDHEFHTKMTEKTGRLLGLAHEVGRAHYDKLLDMRSQFNLAQKHAQSLDVHQHFSTLQDVSEKCQASLDAVDTAPTLSPDVDAIMETAMGLMMESDGEIPTTAELDKVCKDSNWIKISDGIDKVMSDCTGDEMGMMGMFLVMAKLPCVKSGSDYCFPIYLSAAEDNDEEEEDMTKQLDSMCANKSCMMAIMGEMAAVMPDEDGVSAEDMMNMQSIQMDMMCFKSGGKYCLPELDDFEKKADSMCSQCTRDTLNTIYALVDDNPKFCEGGKINPARRLLQESTQQCVGTYVEPTEAACSSFSCDMMLCMSQIDNGCEWLGAECTGDFVAPTDAPGTVEEPTPDVALDCSMFGSDEAICNIMCVAGCSWAGDGGSEIYQTGGGYGESYEYSYSYEGGDDDPMEELFEAGCDMGDREEYKLAMTASCMQDENGRFCGATLGLVDDDKTEAPTESSGDGATEDDCTMVEWCLGGMEGDAPACTGSCKTSIEEGIEQLGCCFDAFVSVTKDLDRVKTMTLEDMDTAHDVEQMGWVLGCYHTYAKDTCSKSLSSSCKANPNWEGGIEAGAGGDSGVGDVGPSKDADNGAPSVQVGAPVLLAIATALLL